MQRCTCWRKRWACPRLHGSRSAARREHERVGVRRAAQGLKKNKEVTEALKANGIQPIWHDGTEEGRKAALQGW